MTSHRTSISFFTELTEVKLGNRSSHLSDNHLIICNSTFSKKNHPAKFLHKLLAKLQTLIFKIFFTVFPIFFLFFELKTVTWILKMDFSYISGELEIIDRTQDDSCARISGTSETNFSIKKKTLVP